jgi:hypothetical protein
MLTQLAALALVINNFLQILKSLFCSSSTRQTIRSRIHERSISSSFLGIILRVLRLEVSVSNVYITNQFQPTFAQGGVGEGGGVKSVIRGDCDYQGGKL